MIKLFTFCLTSCLVNFALLAGDLPVNYNVAGIPKTLQPYANAIIRNQETQVEVKALDHVIVKRKEALTILNANGAEYGQVAIYYNKSRQIKNLKAVLYDGEGKLLKKIGPNDFQDVSAISDYSLFEDDRVKYFSPSVKLYPYTVEYEYELRLKNSFIFPAWQPQPAADVAVESSQYRFTAKPDFSIRVKEFNVLTPRSENQTTDTKTVTWQTQNIAAIRSEPYSPSGRDIFMRAEIAPVKFSYEGITGQFNNWQEYGQWAYDNLVKGRDNLPAATVAHITELVKNLNSPQEKVKKVYEYAQQKNRYISVQVGIGGMQPIKAEEVDRLGYGDCKALTNYTKALLQAANVKSYYTEVCSGANKKNYLADFASAGQGNHVILCVPMPQDTIWLECTSREAPMGYLGTFTDNRKVLLYTESGGVIARTKKYTPEQNRQIRTATLTLDEKGMMSGTLETRYEGTQYDNREAVMSKNGRERTDLIKNVYPINNLEVIQYALEPQKSLNPFLLEKMEIKATGYGTLSDNMLMIPIYQLDTSIGVPKEVRNRKQKVNLARGFYDEDQITYNLPAQYKPEYLPPALALENEFGSYQTTVTFTPGKLTYSRKLLLKEGEFAPEAYDKFQDFLKKVVNADSQKFVLIKQPAE